MTARRAAEAAEAGDPAALDNVLDTALDNAPNTALHAALGRQLFVYYQVNQADLDQALTAARSAQMALLLRHASLAAALWRRPGVRDQKVTLMETYTSPGGLDASLAAAIEQQAEAGAAWRCGQRHCEWFDPA